MPTLLYHAPTGTGVSPFDEAVLQVARSGDVRIVSPYIGVAYLERIIGVSPEWRLVSDVQEWLASLSTQARPRAWAFIREHLPLIHHCPDLHAKAVISNSLAMMGSANLTNHGILGRTEMGILLDDTRMVAELGAWFEDLWHSTAPPLVDEANAYIQWLDTEASQSPSRRQRVTLSSDSRKIRARLAKLDVKPLAQKAEGLLDLSTVAKAIIVQDQKRYDSLDAALEAALDRLTAAGDFSFGDVVVAARQGFASASLREIYFLLVQRCANHVRSVFAEATQNRLILNGGWFSQSSHESLFPALAHFDAFLAYLLSKLAISQARALPAEERIERDTGVVGGDQVILVSELLDSGVLILHDIPGALPHYSLDAEFEWDRRYKLFPQAHAAWLVRMRENHPQLDEKTDDADEQFDDAYNIEIYAPNNRFLLHADLLPEEIIDSDSSYDATNIDKALLEVAELQRQHTRASLEDARKKAKREHQYVDALLARLLPMVLTGQIFAASSRRALIQAIAKAAGVRVAVAAKAISDVPVFLVTHAKPNMDFRLEINANLTMEMLDTYPKTIAACERLLGERRAS